MSDAEIKQAIVAILRERGPTGWYGLEIRLRVPRSEFRHGYTLMTYLDELVADGTIRLVEVSGRTRYAAAE